MEYSENILIEMLDIAICGLNENEVCTYCSLNGSDRCVKDDDVCKSGIWNGLQNQAIKSIKKVS